MQVLIGSQALQYYKRLHNRIPADFDFIGPKSIEGAEYFNFEENSNKIIYEICQDLNLDVLETPFGQALVAPLEMLKLIKIASLPINKAKHSYDLKYHFDNVEVPCEWNKLLIMRTEETEVRVQKQRVNKFFSEANFPRLMDHDLIHSYVSKDPMYKRILKDGSSYIGDKKKFQDLSFDEKTLLLFEEILVFGIERDLLPRIKAFPSLIHNTVEAFSACSKSSDSAFYWFFKFSTLRAVKGTPVWQSEWIQDNQRELLERLPEYWLNKIDNLDVDFWDEVIKICFVSE